MLRPESESDADAEIVVYSGENQKSGDQSYEAQNDRQENSQWCPESKKQKSSKPETYKGNAEIRVVFQRGVVYNITINWHRIKINVLTGCKWADWSINTQGN